MGRPALLNSQKLFEIYSQPVKWYTVKYVICVVVLFLIKLKDEILYFLLWQSKSKDGKSMEKLQDLSEDANASDSVDFKAVSPEGFYFYGSIDRRHETKAHGFLYLMLPENNLYRSPKLPKTTLQCSPTSIFLMDSYSAEGLTFKPKIPMKEWKVSFKGLLRCAMKTENLEEVVLQAKWSSKLPYFLFNTDFSIKMLATCLAKQPWNKNIFERLRSSLIYYEQFGSLNGSVSIRETSYKLKMSSMRNHFSGYKKDWSQIHRYVTFVLFLKDGTNISYGTLSTYSSIPFIEMGYVVNASNRLHAVDSSDFRLYQHGKNGHPPMDIAFILTANGQHFEVAIQAISRAEHFIGDRKNARIVLQFLECQVNGIEGRGFAEWHYNQQISRD